MKSMEPPLPSPPPQLSRCLKRDILSNKFFLKNPLFPEEKKIFWYVYIFIFFRERIALTALSSVFIPPLLPSVEVVVCVYSVLKFVVWGVLYIYRIRIIGVWSEFNVFMMQQGAMFILQILEIVIDEGKFLFTRFIYKLKRWNITFRMQTDH